MKFRQQNAASDRGFVDLTCVTSKRLKVTSKSTGCFQSLTTLSLPYDEERTHLTQYEVTIIGKYIFLLVWILAFIFLGNASRLIRSCLGILRLKVTGTTQGQCYSLQNIIKACRRLRAV